MDKNDKNTWTKERVHMPHHKTEPVKTFAPKVWDAICDLLGGEDKIEPYTFFWNDAFIVNLGTEEGSGPGKVNDPYKLNNWHVDGDFFVHFLDSPEQALLVIPLFSDIKPRGGGTMISPDGIDLIARSFHNHPEGVIPTACSFTPVTPTIEEAFQITSNTKALVPDPESVPGHWSNLARAQECKRFFEMTGEIGDVILLHPMMLHSFQPNLTRALRVITNPPVAIKEPFKFSTKDGHKLCLVERKTLKALGVEELPDWKITGQRRRVVPERVRQQQILLEEEKNRLKLQAGMEDGSNDPGKGSGSYDEQH